MATIYCSHCAAKLVYEVVKPTSCTKCRKPIKDAMAILNQAIQAAPRQDPFDDTDVNEGIEPNMVAGAQEVEASITSPPPAVSPRSRPVTRRRPPERPLAHNATVEDHQRDSDDEAYASEGYDPQEVKQLARQWAAAFDANSIKITPEIKGERVTLGAMWREGRSSREGQS